MRLREVEWPSATRGRAHVSLRSCPLRTQGVSTRPTGCRHMYTGSLAHYPGSVGQPLLYIGKQACGSLVLLPHLMVELQQGRQL